MYLNVSINPDLWFRHSTNKLFDNRPYSYSGPYSFMGMKVAKISFQDYNLFPLNKPRIVWCVDEGATTVSFLQ